MLKRASAIMVLVCVGAAAGCADGQIATDAPDLVTRSQPLRADLDFEVVDSDPNDGSLDDPYIEDVLLSPTGELVVSGHLNHGAVNLGCADVLDPIAGTPRLAFVAKFDVAGQCQWATTWPSAQDYIVSAGKLALTPSGHIALAQPIIDQRSSITGLYSIIRELDRDGAERWSTQLPFTAYGIGVDDADRIVVSGVLQRRRSYLGVAIPELSVPQPPGAVYRVFVISWDAQRNLAWTTSFGGVRSRDGSGCADDTSSQACRSNVSMFSLAVDGPSGDIAILGRYTGEGEPFVDLAGQSSAPLPPGVERGLFVQTIDAQGAHLASRAGEVGPSTSSTAATFAPDGTLYVTGYFADTLPRSVLGPQTLFASDLRSTGPSDMDWFVVGYRSASDLEDVTTWIASGLASPTAMELPLDIAAIDGAIAIAGMHTWELPATPDAEAVTPGGFVDVIAAAGSPKPSLRNYLVRSATYEPYGALDFAGLRLVVSSFAPQAQLGRVSSFTLRP